MSRYRLNRKPFNSSSIRYVRYRGRTFYNPRNYPVIRSNVATSRNYYPASYKDYSYLGARWVTENNNRYTGGRTSEYSSYWRMPRLSVFSLAFGLYLFLLIFIAGVRITNDKNIVSFESLLKYLGDFEWFSSIVRKIEIPSIDISENVPILVKWLGKFANAIIGAINIFWSIGKMLWRVIYVVLSIIIWVIFGV